jgi:hypothetical protein
MIWFLFFIFSQLQIVTKDFTSGQARNSQVLATDPLIGSPRKSAPLGIELMY